MARGNRAAGEDAGLGALMMAIIPWEALKNVDVSTPELTYERLAPQDKQFLRRIFPHCILCRFVDSSDVDHCHVHQYVRGVVCSPCNRTVERVVIGGMTPQQAIVAACLDDRFEARFGHKRDVPLPEEFRFPSKEIVQRCLEVMGHPVWWYPADEDKYYSYAENCHRCFIFKPKVTCECGAVGLPGEMSTHIHEEGHFRQRYCDICHTKIDQSGSYFCSECQCTATTKKKSRCRNPAVMETKYCSIHTPKSLRNPLRNGEGVR